MAENSKIEWTTHTFSPWEGCTKVSAGCANCYAETRSERFKSSKWGPSGTRVVRSEKYWRDPVKWNANAEGATERPRVFCASLADVFEDWQGPMLDHTGTMLDGGFGPISGPHIGAEVLTMANVRARLFRLIDATPNLDWLLLTKRPENIARMMPWARRGETRIEPAQRQNIWLGASVENQTAADERIPHLLRVPAKVRFLSCEPLLGPVDLTRIPTPTFKGVKFDSLLKQGKGAWGAGARIDWVIVGGESGPGARPMHPAWARSLRDQCQAAGVAFHFKQWGEWAPGSNFPDRIPSGESCDFGEGLDDNARARRVGKKAAGRLLDGREWNEVPA